MANNRSMTDNLRERFAEFAAKNRPENYKMDVGGQEQHITGMLVLLAEYIQELAFTAGYRTAEERMRERAASICISRGIGGRAGHADRCAEAILALKLETSNDES